MNRRKFLKKSLYGAGGLGLLTGLYTWQVEPFWYEFVYHKMPIKNLPPELDGKRLIQLSDIHVGDHLDNKHIKKAFERTQKLEPDFVVYTGDFVSYKNNHQLERLKDVMQKAVLGKLGTAAVLGNHDYGTKWSEQKVADGVTNILEDVNIKVLINQEHNFHGLNIMGIDDYWSLNFHPEKVMTKYDESKANLVLCHNPDVCDLDVWNGYQGWILSGHTHGGQVKAPFLPPPILPVKNRRYTAGEFDLGDGRTLYINRALGHLHQVRFNVRPEITVFELSQA